MSELENDAGYMETIKALKKDKDEFKLTVKLFTLKILELKEKICNLEKEKDHWYEQANP